jgi:hypothetical protein
MSTEDLEPFVERPLVRMANTVTTRRVEWLWENYLPLGKVAMLDGPPGVGKSSLLMDLAARVTTGANMPDNSPGLSEPASVVYVNYEDDASDTVVPRFLAAFGATKRLALLEGVLTEKRERRVALPFDVDHIARVVLEKDARLVVIDPVMAAIGGNVNSGADNEVRDALTPLKRLAEDTGAAVVLVRHLNKDSRTVDPLLRGGGSIAFIGLARAGLIAVRDVDEPDRCVLALSKTNLAPPDTPGMAYRLGLAPEQGCSAVVWEGTTGDSAQELLAKMADAQSGGPALEEAVEVLSVVLEAGPLNAEEARKQCRAAGVADRTLDRAKRKLRVRSKRRSNGKTGEWLWGLPGADFPA